MARKPRVVIPTNPNELMQLTSRVYAHHLALGARSPLTILDLPTWEELGPEVEEALDTQAQIEEMERNLKELYGKRAPYLDKFTDATRRSRDLLLAKHAANPAALGPYGFDVIESPKPTPKDKGPDKK